MSEARSGERRGAVAEPTGSRPRVVERVEDPAAFDALRDEWDEVLHASASDCLFLSWEWLRTWWVHLGGGRRLQILTVRHDGELTGLAPLALRPPDLRRLLPFRALEWLGTGVVGSDYLDLIIRRGTEEESLGGLAQGLAASKLMLELGQLRRGTCAAGGLAARLERQRWRAAETQTNVCPFVRLAGHSWPSYLASLGSAHRYNFQRRLKNLYRQYDVRFELVKSEAERREGLDVLVALHGMRWRARGGGSEAFESPALRAFYDDFSRLALQRGWLRLFVLRLDGRPAASIHSYRHGRRFYFYQSGFDPAFAKQSVGLVTMGLVIKHAIEEGADEYDLLHGGEAYKFLWAREARELGRLELYPPGPRGQAYSCVMGMSRTARRTARRLLDLARARATSCARPGPGRGWPAADGDGARPEPGVGSPEARPLDGWPPRADGR